MLSEKSVVVNIIELRRTLVLAMRRSLNVSPDENVTKEESKLVLVNFIVDLALFCPLRRHRRFMRGENQQEKKTCLFRISKPNDGNIQPRISEIHPRIIVERQELYLVFQSRITFLMTRSLLSPSLGKEPSFSISE